MPIPSCLSLRRSAALWLPALAAPMAIAMPGPENRTIDAFPPAAIAAFRLDFDDFEGAGGFRLDLERAELLARALEFRVTVLRHDGRKANREAVLNQGDPEARKAAGCLVYEAGKFSVFKRVAVGELERVEAFGPASESRRRQIARAVYFACHDAAPSEADLEELLQVDSSRLDDADVEDALLAMQARLLDPDEAPPYRVRTHFVAPKGGPVGKIWMGAYRDHGPRTSEWFRQDPAFRDACSGGWATDKGRPAAGRTPPPPVPLWPGLPPAAAAPPQPCPAGLAEDEDEQLQRAIQLSLGANGAPDRAPAGSPPAAPAPPPERKEEPFRCQDYRDDLCEPPPARPTYLGLAEAGILARELGLGLPLLAQGPPGPGGAPRLRVILHLNQDADGPPAPAEYYLFFEDNHYCLLERADPLDSARALKGFLAVKGQEQPWPLAETVRDRPGPGVIKADGNCLITSLHYLAHRTLPAPEAIARLRARLAATLTDEQILTMVHDLREDLAAREFLLEHEGGLPGLGPRLNRWLKQDPRIQAAVARGHASGARPGPGATASP